MNGTLAEEIRWRVAMRLIIWGLKIAPAGDARGRLIDACASWAAEGRRQRERILYTDEDVDQIVASKDDRIAELEAALRKAAEDIKRLRERIADLEANADIAEHSGGYGI